VKKIRDTLVFKFVEKFLLIMGICYLGVQLNVTYLDLGVPFGSFSGQFLFSFIVAAGITIKEQSIKNT
jgi:hypothetical protein